jgi:hypothetical protein
MIELFQIRLNDDEIIYANAPEANYPPKVRAYYDMMSGGHSKWRNDYAQFYKLAMVIDTDDLEEAFDAANGYGQASVKRYCRNHSASVGDIFVKDGDCYIIDAVGFTNVGKYELGAPK